MFFVFAFLGAGLLAMRLITTVFALLLVGCFTVLDSIFEEPFQTALGEAVYKQEDHSDDEQGDN